VVDAIATVVVVDAGTVVVVVVVVVEVVVEVATGRDAIVVGGSSTGFAAAWLTNCMCADVAGGPPTTNAPAQSAESPSRAPHERHANRARCCWRERSTTGSSTNEPPT
jgi:hypothetical protein